MLVTFIVLYLAASIAIGLFAARRVHNTADYAVAGRSLPLAVVIATTFATWFGSETVLGAPAQFVKEGLGGTVEDPFGAGMCLVLVGLFFARKLYAMNIITIGDYYRQRYGRAVEVLCSCIIIFSYLGWVGAQITALGLVFNLLSHGAISLAWGMVIGTVVVLVYTLYGGMWSVALTDFVQMIVIAVGLLLIAWYAGEMAGGAGKVIDYAAREGKFNFLPTGGLKEWTFFIAAAITMMLGSIPQQDVFQRVMSSNNARTARTGPVVGGLLYIGFAFVPMFVVMAALIVMPGTAELLADDPQKVLPTLVMERMPVGLQVAFFGALLSAIMSTASATLLAPSTTSVENILSFRISTTSAQMPSSREFFLCSRLTSMHRPFANFPEEMPRSRARRIMMCSWTVDRRLMWLLYVNASSSVATRHAISVWPNSFTACRRRCPSSTMCRPDFRSTAVTDSGSMSPISAMDARICRNLCEDNSFGSRLTDGRRLLMDSINGLGRKPRATDVIARLRNQITVRPDIWAACPTPRVAAPSQSSRPRTFCVARPR